MIQGDSNQGSLGPTIWLFVLCLFYLLPVIVLKPYIGGWAWLAGIGFWVLLFFTFKYTARKLAERNNDDERDS